MSTRLDPTVAEKLQRLRRRRWLLLVVRGLCAAAVAFVLCMVVVAILDWYWVLTDRTRWGLSVAAYVIPILAVWFTSLRKLANAPAEEELASHVEEAEPVLRENLLSAVELATDQPDAVNDSPVFRGLLQDKVAKQMTDVRVGTVLPLRTLAGWLVATLLLGTGIAMLLTGGDNRFRTLARRALMPGANIERVSRVKVQILQPTPRSLIIAKDETVAIVVDVTGGDVDEVILETVQRNGEPQQQAMRPRTDSEFAANLHIENDTEYRILAGDAITMRHTIKAKDRPRVVAFHKTFNYPAYSGLESCTITEDNGDLVVLEGTQATLRLELDQAVTTAELRIDSQISDEATTVPLTKDDNYWCATVTVTDAAIYKVHLVSAETGFENLFAPRHEIRPIPDLIPRAGFVDQKETELLLPPNDILALKGMAQDDLPLQTLEQEVSVNGRDWQAFPLEVTTVAESKREGENNPQQSAYQVKSAWDWDLLGLKVRTGDQVTTRLVATDLKGNRGESVPIRIVVSAPEFDPQRHTIMETKARLFDDFARFDKIVKEHRQSAQEILQRLRKNDQAEEQRALDRTSLVDLATKLREASGDLLDRVVEVTRAMPAAADAFDLNLAGRVVARIRQEHANRVISQLKVMQHAKDSGEANRDLDQVKRAFDRAADDANRVAHHYRDLMSHNVVAAIATDLDALLRQQRLVVDSPTQTWSRLTRQETLVRSQLQLVGRLVESQSGRMTGQLRDRLRELGRWVQQQTERLDEAMESEDRLRILQQLSQNLLRELEQRQRYNEIDGGLPARLTQTRKDFDYRSGTMSEPLTLASNAIREETRLSKQISTADDSSNVTEDTRKAKRFAAELDLQHVDSLEQIRIRRTLAQARIDGDPQFAADAGMTSRAVASLLSKHRQGDPEESIVPRAFNEITPAFRILEAGHDLVNTRICLATLIQLERWNSHRLTGRTDHPRQWDAVHKSLERAAKRLREAGVDREIIGRLDQLRWSPPVQDANRQIGQRRWNHKEIVSASSELAELQDGLDKSLAELKPVMTKARETIAKYAPTISEMAAQLAKRTRELEKETTAVADAVEQTNANQEPDTPQLADVKEEQQRINGQLDDLFEALIEDANKQDLLDKEQRERARDADDSIAMVRDPAEQATQAVKAATDQPAAEQQAKELSKAAEQQEKTAQALDKIANHFDRLDKNQDVAQSRAELREAERELGIARQMDQKFEPAEQLAQQAERDPADLLAELEKELKSNPAMQDALSEISKNTAEEARNALQAASKQEREIQRANEQSDQAFQQKKREVVQQLRELGQKTDAITRLAQQANSSASQAKTPEAQKQFDAAQKKLQKAAQDARQANETELLSQLAQKALNTQKAIDDAVNQLKSGQQDSAAAKDEKIHANENDRKTAQRRQEGQRRRFRDQEKRAADQVVRQAQQRERQADQRIKNERNQVKARDRELKQAEKNLKRKPDDKNLKQRVAQAESRKRAAEKKVDLATQQKQAAQQKTAQARKQRSELNKKSDPSLKDQNPAAQAAEAYAAEAREGAEALKQAAEEIAKAADFGDQVKPTDGQLKYAKGLQERVANDVRRVAENVDRAARHERRLENANAAEKLGQAADAIAGVANNEVKQATKQLDAAQQAAAQGEGENGDNKPAMAANQKLAESEQAIAEQADGLGEVLQPTSEAAAASAAGTKPPTTPAEAAKGQQLAQALDQLDRAMQAGSQPGKPGRIPGLAQSAKQQQQQMAAARSKAQTTRSQPKPATNPDGTPAYDGDVGTFVVTPVNRDEAKEWGKLREQAANDLTKGRRESVAADYRESVDAYFKVLAERARRGK